MIIRERRHSIITVIVIRLVPNRHTLHTSLLGSFLEVLGKKLALLVEVVSGALYTQSSVYISQSNLKGENRRGKGKGNTYNINQNIQPATLPLLQQFRSIMLLPLLLLIFPKVSRKGLLSPRAVNRVGDGRERRHGLVFAGVAEELSQVLTLKNPNIIDGY